AASPAEPRSAAAPNRIAPVLSPPASAIHVPVLPKRWNTGPIASRPSGAPSPLAVSTAVITFGRSVTGGRVVRMPMNGAFTIGTKKPHVDTAAHATGHGTSATTIQIGSVTSRTPAAASRIG